jgi:hypothetical protein
MISSKIKWAWINGKWTEVVPIQTHGWQITYLDLDTKEEHIIPSSEIHDKQPDKDPLPDGGDVLRLVINRTIILTDTIERTHMPEEFDTDELEDMYDSEIQPQYSIREVHGYQNDYICGWCEECSISEEDKDKYRCQRCHKEKWVFWNDKPNIFVRTHAKPRC